MTDDAAPAPNATTTPSLLTFLRDELTGKAVEVHLHMDVKQHTRIGETVIPLVRPGTVTRVGLFRPLRAGTEATAFFPRTMTQMTEQGPQTLCAVVEGKVYATEPVLVFDSKTMKGLRTKRYGFAPPIYVELAEAAEMEIDAPVFTKIITLELRQDNGHYGYVKLGDVEAIFLAPESIVKLA